MRTATRRVTALLLAAVAVLAAGCPKKGITFGDSSLNPALPESFKNRTLWKDTGVLQYQLASLSGYVIYKEGDGAWKRRFQIVKPGYEPKRALLEPGYVVGVLPWEAAPAEVAWLDGWLASNTSERALLIKHDAVHSTSGVRLGDASTLTTRFGARIVGVLGGHFLPPDRVGGWSNAGFTVFSNYQLGALLGYRPEGMVTMLDHYLATDTWCIRTINYLTGELNRFEPPHCL